MIHRLKDLEGSYLENISNDLIECVCRKKIFYKPSIRYTKGKIKKATLIDNELELIVSKGHFYQNLIGILIIIAIIIYMTGGVG